MLTSTLEFKCLKLIEKKYRTLKLKPDEYKSSIKIFYRPRVFGNIEHYLKKGTLCHLKKQFWNQKILSWERSKYKNISRSFDINSSVKYRFRLASSVLHQVSKEKTLLELGCGSGRLWESVSSLDFTEYKGLDFSETAIKVFQDKIQEQPKRNRISLFCEDCIQNTYAADIVISLGLLDWLDMKQIKRISEKYKNSWFLHSFSEKRLSLSQAAHFIYSLINYTHNHYSPRYRKADELLSVFGTKAKIYRDPRLSFGAFIYHLPSDIQFKC